MNIDNCYQLGYIIKVHGTKGGVVAFLDVDNLFEYKELESVFLLIDNELVPFFIYKIESTNHSKKLIFHFDDISTLEDAEKLKGIQLYLPDQLLPELDNDQFYYHEIIDYEVVDSNHGLIGKVSDVFEMPSNDLLSVMHNDIEVLIPIVDEIVLEVDKKTQKIFVNMPEGLLEIYTNPNSQK